MKEYLVLSYEGTVLIKHIPNNIKSYDIVDIAREVISEIRNKPLTGLSNVETFINYKAYCFLEENPWIKENLYVVEYEDYK